MNAIVFSLLEVIFWRMSLKLKIYDIVTLFKRNKIVYLLIVNIRKLNLPVVFSLSLFHIFNLMQLSKKTLSSNDALCGIFEVNNYNGMVTFI